MRIAYIISSCSSGGAELLVRRLCTALMSAEVEIQLWVTCRAKDSYENCPKEILDFEADYVSDMEDRGLTVRFLDKRKNGDRLTACHQLRSYYKDFHPDIVHAHSEICALYMAVALTGINCVRIQTIHSSKIFYPPLIKYYLSKRVNEFVSISEEVSFNMIGASIPANKITLINNGIELERYKYPERNFERHPVKIIAVGRLAKEKDYPYLLQAVKLAFKRMSETNIELPNLDIVGTGALYDEIQKLIREEQLENHVSLLGLRKDIPSLLKQADIYVMSSSFEGLSLSLIEAAACGLPIIATNVGSNCKLVQPGVNGELIEHGDVTSFSDAVIAIAADAALRIKYSKKSVEISVGYDIRNTAKQHMELYTKSINKKIKR